jgi:hypothetical protein
MTSRAQRYTELLSIIRQVNSTPKLSRSALDARGKSTGV